ncbi:LptF/LptG family permease [Eudoraea sp.]|uniref:LptF/LptG family permease n=2 Tax=Eudoraea sp. TaxID=1979955 RepID=UPI003C76AF20
MFIFVFQTIWLFIDDLAGKGLDIIIIGKFLFYLLPNLTEKVLPLTVLLSSILTFGAFAENYEFAAMKASGISLQRAMLPLIILVIFLGGVAFFFANSVIPASEQKIYNLRRNIAKVKPAAVIVEGVFSDVEGFNIKVDEKYGENDKYLKEVVIHKKTNLEKNNTVIKAKTGELRSSQGSDIIQLVLTDGHYYEEIVAKSGSGKDKSPFARSNFETYIINIEIPENDQDLEEERNVRTDKMKNVSRLNKDIDSLRENNVKIVAAFSKNITNRMGAFLPVSQIDTTLKTTESKIDTTLKTTESKIILDTVLKSTKNMVLPILVQEKDTVQIDNVLDLYREDRRIHIVNAAKNSISNILNSVLGKKEELQRRYKIYNMHILSLHKKFALALSCIILFFVGAPLGAIIRKGGLGLPMVIAIVLFLTYYFIGVFAGNYAKEGNIHPIFGAWLSTLIMLPLGIYLTKRATADRGLMDFGYVIEKIKDFFRKKIKVTAS